MTTDKAYRFVDAEKWRASFGGGVDELVKTFDYKEKAQMMAYYPQYYHKTDKDGRPVYIEQYGKIDLAAMRKISTDERMLENLVVEYEKLADPRLPAASRKAGVLLETCCTIFDFKGVGLWKAKEVYGYVQRASAISQNYYPERLGKMYLINTPWGFSSVFSVIKGFLDPVTVNKIHVLGSGYQKELLAQVPAENLPSEFGGKCNCAGGCQLSDEGPCEWKAKESAWSSMLMNNRDGPAMGQASRLGDRQGWRQHNPSDYRCRRRRSTRWHWQCRNSRATRRPTRAGPSCAVDTTSVGQETGKASGRLNSLHIDKLYERRVEVVCSQLEISRS